MPLTGAKGGKSTSVTSIGNYSFDRCSGLTSIEIPESVTSIGDQAFSNCSSLTNIEIPGSVISIGSYAFYNCSSLSDVYFIGSEEEWNAISIEDGNELLKNATIHYNDSPSISISITPQTGNVIRGTSLQFQVDITGENDPDTSVTWNVSGSTSSKTSISDSGLLTVGSDETSTSLTVTAVSNADSSKSASAQVSVKLFTDVEDNMYYSTPVIWGASNSVVTGYPQSDGTSVFKPNDSCTRAQFVTFLWRAFGSPEPTTTSSPFADVASNSAYYYKAVLWAYENNITTGYTGGGQALFGTDDLVTRGQAVTFLWRAAGSPSASTTTNPFVDVTNPGNEFYGTAMLWGSENGIVTGYTDASGAKFAPDDSCTRGQVVTFLYRYAQKFLNA